MGGTQAKTCPIGLAHRRDDDLRATLDSDTFPRGYALPLHIGQCIG